jgi:PBP1b-binding outer membrane lipoprotein LpoB
MKRVLLVAICFALLCAGCVELKSSVGQNKADQSGSKGAVESAEKLTATITSPRSGEILTGSKEISFDAMIKGGKEPRIYSWNSNIDGVLSTSSSFWQSPSQLSKGQHFLILKVTDANGASAQASVIIQVV